MSKAERRPSQQSSKEKIDAARKAEAPLAVAYYHWSMTPDGQAILADLVDMFNTRTTIRRSGRPGEPQTVDPYASIAAAGGCEVIIYIQSRIAQGSPGFQSQLKDVSHG